MTSSTSLLQQSVAYNGLARAGRDVEARRREAQAFRKALATGLWKRFWAKMAGRDNALQDLSQVLTGVQVDGRSYVGIQSVSISRIEGSEGRVDDFDADFNPLQSHTMERWVSVAVARQRGVVLPPVELVQVGQAYFVRDGHHRISVARAQGQTEIEAEVTRLQVA
jgi:hypothetical protein